MTTWNTELREMIEALRLMEKHVGLYRNSQIIRGKDRDCCIVCGFCPTAMREELEKLLEELEGDNKPIDLMADPHITTN